MFSIKIRVLRYTTVMKKKTEGILWLAFLAAVVVAVILSAAPYGFFINEPPSAQASEKNKTIVKNVAEYGEEEEELDPWFSRGEPNMTGTLRITAGADSGTEANAGNNTVTETAETRPVLILMYHQLLKSRKSKYIVTPETLRADLRTLKKHGFQSIRATDLISYVDGVGTLPKKPVLITFDDGHYSNLFYAKDILQEEGFTAVENVIGKFSENSTVTNTGGNPNYSHLTWDEIREMDGCGVFEIGSHSYDMHNYTPRFGVGQKAGEADAAYRAALSADVTKLQNILREECGANPRVFAYPFGKYNALTKEVLDGLGFRVMLTCNEGISNVKVGDKKSLWQLKRYNRDPEYDMDEFLTKRDKTYASVS